MAFRATSVTVETGAEIDAESSKFTNVAAGVPPLLLTMYPENENGTAAKTRKKRCTFDTVAMRQVLYSESGIYMARCNVYAACAVDYRMLNNVN